MKGMLLLSTGIDSPVAGRILADKGIEIVAVHFMNSDSEEKKEKVIRLVKKIGVKRVYFVVFYNIQKEMQDKCDNKYQCVLCKRMMFRLAEKIAEKEGADFIVTGDNLGQVASQTLDNMGVIDSAVKILKVRPLLCNDKNETMKIAREIGTYDISIENEGVCQFLPKNPATKAILKAIKFEEEKLNVKEIMEKAVKEAEKKDL